MAFVKDDISKYSEITKVRFTPHMKDILELKAKEEGTSVSEIIRQACYEYLNAGISDSRLVYAALTDLKQKEKYLENKIELLAIMTMQQTKKIIQYLPLNKLITEQMTDVEYEKFENDCASYIRKNHSGKLESMVLDLYQKQEEEN